MLVGSFILDIVPLRYSLLNVSAETDVSWLAWYCRGFRPLQSLKFGSAPKNITHFRYESCQLHYSSLVFSCSFWINHQVAVTKIPILQPALQFKLNKNLKKSKENSFVLVTESAYRYQILTDPDWFSHRPVKLDARAHKLFSHQLVSGLAGLRKPPVPTWVSVIYLSVNRWTDSWINVNRLPLSCRLSWDHKHSSDVSLWSLLQTTVVTIRQRPCCLLG
jgi:hypothetical protein